MTVRRATDEIGSPANTTTQTILPDQFFAAVL